MPNILYKIDAKGKVRTWKIQVLHIDGETFLETTTGLKDGKKITHRRNVLRAKSKKTITEQAESEALSKWTRKKDKELYSEIVPKYSKENALVCEKKMRPMLAQSYKPTKKYRFIEKDRCVSQVKLDGTRALAFINDEEIVMKSRTGGVFYAPVVEHIIDTLKQLISKLPNNNFIFDGEIYKHDDMSFQKSQGLLRLTKGPIPAYKMKEIKTLKYHIFDIINLNSLNEPFNTRHRILNDLNPYIKNTSVVIVPLIPITKTTIKQTHNKAVGNGYEGLILRDLDSPYELDKRSKYLLKVKMFEDSEYKITGFTKEARGGKSLIIWICTTKDGKTFNVRPKGTEKERSVQYKKATDFIGKLLTVKYFDLTDDGKPRFPVGIGIREDL